MDDSNFHYSLRTLAGEKNLSVHENSSNWIMHILESYVELKLGMKNCINCTCMKSLLI